jgi:murein DD-endopeptidase MepM/ murein hydrolase activator NlpD
MKSYIIIVIIAIITASCSQEPAKIIYKGHLNFTKNNFINQKNKDRPITVNKSTTKKYQNNNYNKVITIESGDNLYSLARTHKVTIRNIIEANNLVPPYVIYPKERLKLPIKTKFHIVQAGDNLTRISRLYNVSLNELRSVNNLMNSSKIKINDKLILPYDSDQNLVVRQQKNYQKPIQINKKIAKKKSIRKSSKKDDFIWPVDNGSVIQKFGQKPNGTHNDGINIKASLGTPVKSVAAGKIVYVGNGLRGYGNLIIVKHANNWLTAYAHNNDIYVAKDQMVTQGEVISTLGSTGSVNSPQLHFVLRKGRKAVNPEEYLKKSS